MDLRGRDGMPGIVIGSANTTAKVTLGGVGSKRPNLCNSAIVTQSPEHANSVHMNA